MSTEIDLTEIRMKIDTSQSRLPLNRLKHPLKQKSMPPSSEKQIDERKESGFYEAFERELVRDGAKQFKNWVEKIEIK